MLCIPDWHGAGLVECNVWSNSGTVDLFRIVEIGIMLMHGTERKFLPEAGRSESGIFKNLAHRTDALDIVRIGIQRDDLA